LNRVCPGYLAIAVHCVSFLNIPLLKWDDYHNVKFLQIISLAKLVAHGRSDRVVRPDLRNSALLFYYDFVASTECGVPEARMRDHRLSTLKYTGYSD
jgi:hypothetical protein